MSTETKPKAIKGVTGKGICHLADDPDGLLPIKAYCGKAMHKKNSGLHGLHCNVCVVCLDVAKSRPPRWA